MSSFAIGQPARPVVVVFFGGAFIEGGGFFSIPPSGYPVLNVSSENDFVFVYLNYRVNAFGFLPGKAIKDSPTSDLNPGLLDQQYVLQWVNKYIANFGGDPQNVTVWGQSAGAGSVVAQVIANGGNTSPSLFTKALASSPFWPKTYAYDAPEAESIYSTLVDLSGCANATDSLACLKAADVQTLRTAALAISGSHTYNTSSYTWAPVIDGTFLPTPLSQATLNGNVNIAFGFGMYDLHEGENFIPPGLANTTGAGGFNSSSASFQSWLRGFLPAFNSTQSRPRLIYRDLVLACPTYWMASAAKTNGYVGEYTIPPATHGSDTQYSQPLIYTGFAGAFASFFQTGDPNAHKLTNASQPGVPLLASTGEEFVVESDGFENVQIGMLESRCAFWRGVAGKVPV
ncbi:hypothetical protein MMC20_003004 [Loxospora ochrophaea]|nr:hypothetical protein [Loxospora ochrophaea]